MATTVSICTVAANGSPPEQANQASQNLLGISLRADKITAGLPVAAPVPHLDRKLVPRKQEHGANLLKDGQHLQVLGSWANGLAAA